MEKYKLYRVCIHTLYMPSSSLFCDSALLTQVSGLVCDEHNNMYACNFGTPTASIIKIDTTGKATPLTQQYDDRNFVSMVYLDDFLYVTGFNNCVYKVEIHTGELTTFVTLPQNGTNGLTYSDGALYVVCMDGMQTGNVYKINMHGEYSVFISEDSLAGTQYNIITTDKHENFYITDEGNNSVVKYDKEGKLMNSTFITGEHQSVLINKHNIYLTNYLVNKISQYDMEGTLIKDEFAIGGLTFAGGGMAFDHHNNFYFSLEGVNGAGAGNVSIRKIAY